MWLWKGAKMGYELSAKGMKLCPVDFTFRCSLFTLIHLEGEQVLPVLQPISLCVEICRGVLQRVSPRTHLHVVGLLRFMFLT